MRPARRLAGPLAAAVLAVAAVPAEAAGRLSPRDLADVARVEAYLNGLGTLRSAFEQVSSNGAAAAGTIYIARPGRLRVDYEPPSSIQIYASGGWLVHVDTSLEAVAHVPLGETPARFLLEGGARLGEDVAVRRVARSPRGLAVELATAEDPGEGAFTIMFSDDPLALRGWSVVDARGVTTRVTLRDPVFGAPVPPGVFVFDEERFRREEDSP